MVSCFISRLVILIFGTLYPAYASYKAVRTKNVKEYVKWMMYWIVFALFTCAETFTDLFLSFWFPFYYEIKIITVIYLLSPATKGSSILYRKFVHPVLTKREQEIDEYIAKAKEQGYHTMLNLGSKGVTYATSLIMQTAIKGGGGLVNQLRKSYSLGDLNEEQHLRRQKRESEDDVDSQYDEDPRIPRRVPVRSPRHTISGTNQPGLFFSEVDAYQPLGPDDEPYYSEELSSGYSSGDPLFSSKVHPRDHLVRTASVGGSSRVRTRAAARTGLPKRSSLSEVGPTWSAMEAHESQIEPERYFNFPLTHSASFPFPFGPFGNFARPEFQHMFGNLTQQQMFTFINHAPAFFDEGIKNETENPTVVISEIKNDNPVTETVEVLDDDKKEDSGGKIKEKIEDKKQEVDDNKEKEIVQIDNKDKEVVKVDNKDKEVVEVDNKEVAKVDRSGKYKKKPAPVPPVGDVPPKDESDDEDVEFTTPNSSPLPERKKISEKDSVPESKKNTETNSGQLLEVPKTKTKNKSNKKLHLPKMAFSFWHKGNKRLSGSETSSIASSENFSAANESRSELEYLIPLKDDSEEQTKTDSK